MHILFAIIELDRLKVTEYSVRTDKVKREDKLRIAVLSDIHCCSFGKDNSKLINMLYSAEPDLIVISGDLINGMEADEISFGEDLLQKLNQYDIPVVYEYGNHEARLNNRDEKAFIRYTGIAEENSILLRNKSYKVNDSVRITGLDIPEYMYRRGDFTVNLEKMTAEAICSSKSVVSEAICSSDSKVSEEAYQIVVAHDPSHFELYSRAGADLVISGHFHGGIIRLPFLGGLISPKLELFPKYSKGLYYYKNSVMCLSAGIGWHNLPIRFMNRPEIVIINLESRK